MRTQKQILASRENGRKSSGAVTPEGKARIVAANLKSGIFAESEVLPWDDAQSLEQLESEYYAHHQPGSPEARDLLDELVSCTWTLRRLRRADSNLLAFAFKQTYQPNPDFAPAQAVLWADKYSERLQRRINSTRLAYHRTLRDLERVEARDRAALEQAAQETAPEIAVDPPAEPAPAGNLRRLPRTDNLLPVEPLATESKDLAAQPSAPVAAGPAIQPSIVAEDGANPLA